MPYLYLCCLYYLFITLLGFWHQLDIFVFRVVGENGIFIMLVMLLFFFITASFYSVILSWKEKRWFPVLMHQGIFWGLYAVIVIYIIPY